MTNSLQESDWHSIAALYVLYLLPTCQAWNPMMWFMPRRRREINIFPLSLQLPLRTFAIALRIIEFIIQIINSILVLISGNTRAP